ncbi:hypothetical protein [Mycolicibacterium peregrinum]|uniref:Uncharacterized protein n=1 Tax=Mycolicibacterium peregrinum TaxID=43304 RepID=A0A4Z0HKW2_MYCPR|nr:hypothetical protein [Mycolicibacterium peregrinum]TGB37865.1 hypothetical protein EJD98_25275 [Mycolicibacterium peregrinum]TGB38116.1 hypothetical protein EJD94_25290 [Mycolicibacterium peregrinum]
MGFAPVQLLVEPTYQAMRFNGTYADAKDLVDGIQAVLTARTLVRGEVIGLVEGEMPPEWRVRLVRPDGTELYAYTNWWVVAYSTGLIEVYEDGPYRAKFTLPEGME